MTDDEVEAWLARTRTARADHHLPHEADRASLRTRLRGGLDALGVPPDDRDAVVEMCAAEMSRLFSEHATAARADEPAPESARAEPAPVRADVPPPAPAPAPAAPRAGTPAPVSTAATPTRPTPPAPPAGWTSLTSVTRTSTMPGPPSAVAPTGAIHDGDGRDDASASVHASVPRGWFRSQWRRLHWSGRVALVFFGPPVAAVLGLMALCTVSPPVGAAVLGTTNRVFDGEIYGHDFVGFGKGRYETSPWQFTFLHPSRDAMDKLRVQCERDPGFAPSVCATVQHSYRIEERNGTFAKVVDADNEQGWFEREACPALAVVDRRIYSKNLDAGWERYRSHGCVPYDA